MIALLLLGRSEPLPETYSATVPVMNVAEGCYAGEQTWTFDTSYWAEWYRYTVSECAGQEAYTPEGWYPTSDGMCIYYFYCYRDKEPLVQDDPTFNFSTEAELACRALTDRDSTPWCETADTAE